MDLMYMRFSFFKHEVPRFTSVRTGFFYFTSPKAMARFRGSLPTRSVVKGSGSFSLRETHGLILMCFSFIQTSPFTILVEIYTK